MFLKPFPKKDLGVKLDFKSTFEEHVSNVLAKFNKAVGFLRKLCNIFPRATLVSICKAFIRPYLNYGDVLVTIKPLITRLKKNWNLFNINIMHVQS